MYGPARTISKEALKCRWTVLSQPSLLLKVEMCFVALKSGRKLLTHLSLCAKMQRSVNGFLHDKLTESHVFPRPHPFTPAAPGKITRREEMGEKRELRAGETLRQGERKTIGEKNLL